MGEIIKIDFGGRHTQSKYYEIEADEPHEPVIVSVHTEGIEIIQYVDGDLVEVFVTDNQLASIIYLISHLENQKEDTSVQ